MRTVIEHRRFAVTLAVYCVLGFGLSILFVSYVWQLRGELIDSTSHVLYLSAAVVLALAAAMFGALAYGVLFRLVPSLEQLGGPAHTLRRFGGLSTSGGQRQFYLLVLARGGLWIVPASEA